MSEAKTHVWFHSQDSGFGEVLERALGPGFEMRTSDQVDRSGIPRQENWYDVLLLDLRASGVKADLELRLNLSEFMTKSSCPPPPIVALLRGGEHDLMLKVIENGAYDTITDPPDMVELRLILRRAHKFRKIETELIQLRSRDHSGGRMHRLLGSSLCMQQVFALAQKIAPCDVSALVTGETGTGKELLARAIHGESTRAEGPFVGFSCASLAETLIEDELFGHERGAFTGALMARRGRFEAANQGTLFLDEIGDLSLALQSKLLRVLQERCIERLGSNTSLSINIRVICATHRNLPEMVKRGEFREDLYYRLNVVHLHLPSLRERRDDIPFLAQHFLQTFAQQFGKKARRFSRLVMQALEEHQWPGNVRELENVVQRAVVMAEGAAIEVWHLPLSLRNGFEAPHAPLRSYEEEVRDFKRRLIRRILEETGWCKTEAAESLGIARNYLHRLISQLQIHPEQSYSGTPSLDQPPSTQRVM